MNTEPNAERLVAEQVLGHPRGIETARIYELLSDIPPERVDRAIAHLRDSGVLEPSNHGGVIASEPVLLLEALGLLGVV